MLTHGFMVTAQGQKMSKSLGNAIEVEDLLKQYGADICRWWTASLNYTYDIKVDWEFFRVASDEYRKVRNTIRFMLGNLAGLRSPARDRRELAEGDCDARSTPGPWRELAELIEEVRGGYERYQFKRVVDALFDFCNDTMSAVYLAAVKDRLYCDAADSARRRRTQTVLYDSPHALIRMLAPILVHTAEEAWLSSSKTGRSTTESFISSSFPSGSSGPQPLGGMVMELRAEALKQLELAKESQGISNPLDAGVVVLVLTEDRAIARAVPARAGRPVRGQPIHVCRRRSADAVGIDRSPRRAALRAVLEARRDRAGAIRRWAAVGSRRRGGRSGMSVFWRVVAYPIRLYKRFVSPWLPPACRFEPTCSVYAAEAIERHGLYGVWLAIRGSSSAIRFTPEGSIPCHPPTQPQSQKSKVKSQKSKVPAHPPIRFFNRRSPGVYPPGAPAETGDNTEGRACGRVGASGVGIRLRFSA